MVEEEAEVEGKLDSRTSLRLNYRMYLFNS
jgi:hypothetical protein